MSYFVLVALRLTSFLVLIHCAFTVVFLERFKNSLRGQAEKEAIMHYCARLGVANLNWQESLVWVKQKYPSYVSFAETQLEQIVHNIEIHRENYLDGVCDQIPDDQLGYYQQNQYQSQYPNWFYRLDLMTKERWL